MYQKFTAKNFRCFRELEVPRFERVNLITGLNNAGKTALLEALFLHSGMPSPRLILTLNALRGVERIRVAPPSTEQLWGSLFLDFNKFVSIELSSPTRTLRVCTVTQPPEIQLPEAHEAKDAPEAEAETRANEVSEALEFAYEITAQKSRFHLTVSSDGKFSLSGKPNIPSIPGLFMKHRGQAPQSEDLERFGQIQVRKEENFVLDALQLIDRGIRRIVPVQELGQPSVHVDTGGPRLMPLAFMGEGVLRLFTLFTGLLTVRDGILLVDEIENGVHYSILEKVWRAVGEAARRWNVQVFATTHSRECVVAAHKVFSRNGHYDFCLHRLERIPDGNRDVIYDQEALEGAIETDLEVR